MKHPLVLLLVLMVAGCASTSTETSSDGGLAAGDLPAAADDSEDEANSPPKAIHMEVPEYPNYLKQQRISGTVMVYFEVAVDGTVTDAYAAESPHPDLARAAVSAIMKSKFNPALVDGIPTVSHMSVPVRFDLD